MGRLIKIPKAINANVSVVNLAIPQSDEAKAIIDNCIRIINLNTKILSDFILFTFLLIKNYYMY